MKLSNIAIVSPGENVYSETFIQEQKKGLKGNIFYYYNGEIPQFLEGFGELRRSFTTWSVKIKRKFGFKTLSATERAFMYSLKKNKIQVVLAQYGTTSFKIVNICKKLNIPLITHFHGYDASVKSFIEKCDNYKEVFEYSSYVIAVSLSMQKRLIDLGCPKEKLIYNTYGPNDLFLNIVPEFSDSTFVAVGRFVNKKAPHSTILAFKKVYERFPGAKLIIGGTGELFESCLNIVRALKLEDAVLLPGILNQKQFVEYLSTGLAFVQHSVTAFNGDQEGTPVAILEASAAGLPVISTQHAGIPDVIINGETGFLVEEHDVDGMAEKMILLLENKILAQTLGRNGKERIKNNFTLKRHLNVIDDLIEKSIVNIQK
ncbi:glycosyltransferase [Flavobacterium sp. 245]|uniref:glycosyltransferase n=1 Tax=Flavobacterium sp. 245 TaxID=2512115 RepID=UPI00105FCA50|nr:glycosyltransferase [Flavobacterium sp. 245]TDP00880.1 glycosyltransferase involved in cell wall biosynthesis [Flavobacterium sp. 245]